MNDWKASYLKVDYCGARYVSPDPVPQYQHWAALRDALNATGVPIYYSICPHTKAKDEGPGAEYQGILSYAPPSAWTAPQRHELANSLLVEFVNTLDFWYKPHSYGPSSPPGGIITNIDSWVSFAQGNYSAAGSITDLDMLQMCTFGEGSTPRGAGMLLNEYRAHYSVWVVLGSPLIHSADFRTMPREHPECMAMLLNEQVLAVNQDPGMYPARLAKQVANSTMVRSDTITEQVFARPLQGDAPTGTAPSLAVVFLNRGEGSAVEIAVTFQQLGLDPGQQVRVTDLWTGKDMGSATGRVAVQVLSHSARMLRLDGAHVDLQRWNAPR